MPQQIIELLDLDIAWKRVETDFTEDRVFVKHPYELSLIKLDNQHLTDWLDAFRLKYSSRPYLPSPMLICEIPKQGNTVRPGGLLSTEDHLFYTACVSSIFPQIHAHLYEYQNQMEFSYPFAKTFDDPDWLGGYFRAYQRYVEESLKKLDQEEIKYVVFTDITGYYENIDLGILHSDLNQIGAVPNIVSELRNALRIWSQVSISGRGIPQGYSASDILAKLYLHQVDLEFRLLGYQHVRWVDDFKIFCRSESEARLAIITLSRLLRKRGLNLQSGKTEVLSVADAKNKIQGISPILEGVKHRYVDQIIQRLGIENISYFPRIEKIYATSTDETPIEIIKDAYNQYFLFSNPDKKFDKTLFRFLLARFAKQHNDYAIIHSIKYIAEYPSETATILKYLCECDKLYDNDIQDYIAQFLMSEDAVYDYQIYQIYTVLNSLTEYPTSVNRGLITIARKYTFDHNKPAYLRAVCRKFLSNHGTLVDVDTIYGQYAHVSNELEQCEIILATKRMEKTKRNAFITSVQDRSLLHQRAVTLLKQNRIQ